MILGGPRGCSLHHDAPRQEHWSPAACATSAVDDHQLMSVPVLAVRGNQRLAAAVASTLRVSSRGIVGSAGVCTRRFTEPNWSRE